MCSRNCILSLSLSTLNLLFVVVVVVFVVAVVCFFLFCCFSLNMYAYILISSNIISWIAVHSCFWISHYRKYYTSLEPQVKFSVFVHFKQCHFVCGCKPPITRWPPLPVRKMLALNSALVQHKSPLILIVRHVTLAGPSPWFPRPAC